MKTTMGTKRKHSTSPSPSPSPPPKRRKGKHKKKHKSEDSNSDSSSDGRKKRKSVDEHKISRRKMKKIKSKKRKRHYSSDSSSADEKRKKKKKAKKRKKHKKHKSKEAPKNDCEKIETSLSKKEPEDSKAAPGPLPPPKILKPMTKEEWEKQQSVVRRVYDPETGRNRLVKGDGEIIEEIVSKDRHKEINKQATKGDGLYFEHKMGLLQK